MHVLDQQIVDIQVDSNLTENSTTMYQSRGMRTIPLLPLSIVGVVLLVLGPALVRAQSSIRSSKEDDSPYKGFSGLWASNDSMKQVYHHEQTVAVVELGPGKRLENCELVEVTTPEEKKETLDVLRSFSHPIDIAFDEMFQLMEQCQDTVSPLEKVELTERSPKLDVVFQGIVPGTKWCGTSDVAATYYELGREKDVDKCCRTHDLCPIKVRSYRTRYNLTNEQFFTKSHCSCDDRFLQCLKKRNTPLSILLGNVYFNIMRVPCIQEVDPVCSESGCITKKFRKPRQFS
ncbi:uncharacterized protein [Periplaneta americana]|uniref:uncharacterized protein n=1 Tax=Periplaneta americana TaxID=6978 RepID=UPI0037E7F467